MGVILLVRHGQASFGSADYDVLSAVGERQARRLGDALAARGIAPASVISGSLRRQRETAAALVKQAGWALEPSIDAGWDEFDLSGLVAVTPSGQERQDRGAFQDALEVGMRRWAGTEGSPVAGERVAEVAGDRSAEVAGDKLAEMADERFSEVADDRSSEVADERSAEVAGDKLAEVGGEGFAEVGGEGFADFAARAESALRVVAARQPPGATTLVVTSGGVIGWIAASLLGAGVEQWIRLNRVCVNTGVTTLVTGRRGISLVAFNDHSHLSPPEITYR